MLGSQPGRKPQTIKEKPLSPRMHIPALSVRASASHFPISNLSDDTQHLLRAADIAGSSAGLSAPHPNFGCVIARGPNVVGQGFLYAQGTKSAEVQAVERAGGLAKFATAYLNLEPGDCHGDDTAVLALLQAGVGRVVVGMRHPLQHLRGKAISALQREGILVEVGGEGLECGQGIQEALKACQIVNAPLLYRAANGIPYSVLKYAMTLDGKIAASTGHSAWVSSKESRLRVFATRAQSDAIIVGGNTVRRDNPRLTTRQEGGHLPVRIVMSRCLNLPEDANLWDVSTTQTIVMTQRGARQDFQSMLAFRGVEVVEFEFLTPRAVMDYCYDRGYLSVLWECGGMLSAPAISSGVVHKVIAFVAPKIIGGVTAPSPVGELGMVEMTQALKLSDVAFEQIGTDMLVEGYLQPIPNLQPNVPSVVEAAVATDTSMVCAAHTKVISFYKPWDLYGALSNFSPHPICLPDMTGESTISSSVEHYYQAQKFVGVDDPIAIECIQNILEAKSPEEAARFGRSLARQKPHLVRPNWESEKLVAMQAALHAKFTSYPALRELLTSTAGAVLVEASQNDNFWGAGRNGAGENKLGHMLMELRSKFLEESQGNENQNGSWRTLGSPTPVS